MYQNLINSLKKILDDKSTQAEKLLKIKTLVDFAEGLEKQPQWPTMPNYRDRAPAAPYQSEPFLNDAPKPTVTKPAGAGAIVGVEDIK